MGTEGFICERRHTHTTAFKRDRCNRKSGEWRSRRALQCRTWDIPYFHVSPPPKTETYTDTTGLIPVVRFGQPRAPMK